LLAVEAKRARRKPEGITFTQAASLPVAALTALNGLRQCRELKGKSVAINGATGGVGHFALQIANACGARVTAVCRGTKTELARHLGAEVVIDYTQQDFTKAGKKYDVIFDAFAHQGFAHFKPVLAPRGFYAATLPSPSFILRYTIQAIISGPRVVSAGLRARPEDYLDLQGLVLSGAVQPVVEQKFTLAKGRQAFELAETGTARGKIIIDLS
jgi:NADPH:quinone reductase-like Zn-dependent oxidoreductase